MAEQGAALADDFADDNAEALSDEEMAKARGWKPLPADPDNPQPGEYQGDQRRWRPAAEFIRHGETDRAILAEENRRLSQKVARTERQLDELTRKQDELLTALKDMREMASRNDKRGYDRAMEELKAKRAEAVASGDVTTFEQIDAAVSDLQKEQARSVEAPRAAADAPVPAAREIPEITQFIKDNGWYRQDAVLRNQMQAYFANVERAYPDWTIGEQLDEAMRRTAADFPDRIPLLPSLDHGMSPPPPPSRPRAPAVARPTGQAPAPQRQVSGWDRIVDVREREDAQGAYERQRRADPGFTVGEYLTLYFDPHADPLELRRNRKPAK